MTPHSGLAAVEAALQTRLAALMTDIAGIEADRRAPLDADFSEQASELAGQDALGGIEDGKVAEASAIRSALARVADGSYGKCTPDCKRGPYCGDKKLQTPPEECDDGVNLSLYGGCAPGCKKAPFCGDGKVDGAFGSPASIAASATETSFSALP
jgi:cysteine-rich repeat protein